MRIVWKLPLVLIFAGVSGCVTPAQQQAPRAPLEAALKGDTHGANLKPAALRKAISTEIASLNNSQPGTLNNWTSGKEAQGTVIPGTPFEVSGRTCRRYEHRITISGEERARFATACRNDDGIWEPLV